MCNNLLLVCYIKAVPLLSKKRNIIQFFIHLGLSSDFLTFELSIWF